jgi:hypothetical protein
MKGAFVSAGSGRSIVAAKPTLSWYAYGQFSIDNYDPNVEYTHTGATRASGILTITAGTDSTITVTAKTPKGITSSAASTAQRAHTYNDTGQYEYDQESVSATFGSPTPGVWNWTCSSGFGSGGGAWGVGICRKYPGSTWSTNHVYPGMVDHGSEWSAVT